MIDCRNISLAYDREIVLSELSFSVNQGDFLCIVGENGSGKSTLVKALLSLIGIHRGSIEFGLSRNEIGYLPQQTDAQKDFPAGVWEVVLSGCRNRSGLRPFYSAKDRAKAREILERLGIGDLVRRCFRELSGGQQQRVLLARALCSAKKLILLDEPTAGLDPLAANEFYNIINRLNKEGVTVIMVSHDIDNAVRSSTHILHLKNKPVFFGKYGDYLKSGEYTRLAGC